MGTRLEVSSANSQNTDRKRCQYSKKPLEDTIGFNSISRGCWENIQLHTVMGVYFTPQRVGQSKPVDTQTKECGNHRFNISDVGSLSVLEGSPGQATKSMRNLYNKL